MGDETGLALHYPRGVGRGGGRRGRPVVGASLRAARLGLRRSVLLPIAVVVLGLTACVGGSAPQESGGRVSGDDLDARGPGAHVQVPRAALSGDGSLIVEGRSPTDAAPPFPAAVLLSNPVDIRLDGATLSGAAQIDLEFRSGDPAAADPRAIFMATLDPSSGRWVPVESQVAGSQVKASVRHFSVYSVWGTAVDGLRGPVEGAVRSALSAAGVIPSPPPSDCPKAYPTAVSGPETPLVAVCSRRDGADAVIDLHSLSRLALRFPKPAHGRLERVSIPSLGEFVGEQLDAVNEAYLRFDDVWLPGGGTLTWRQQSDELPFSAVMEVSNQGVVYDAMVAAVASVAARLGAGPRAAADILTCLAGLAPPPSNDHQALARAAVDCASRAFNGVVRVVAGLVFGGLPGLVGSLGEDISRLVTGTRATTVRVGGPACDQSSLLAALRASTSPFRAASIDSPRCADGWAVATAVERGEGVGQVAWRDEDGSGWAFVYAAGSNRAFCDVLLARGAPRSVFDPAQCPQSVSGGTPGVTTPNSTAAVTRPANLVLRRDGLGAVSFGASKEETVRVIGAVLGPGQEDRSCGFWSWPGLDVSFTDGRFSSFVAREESRLRTDRGYAPGTLLDQLYATYPDHRTVKVDQSAHSQVDLVDGMYAHISAGASNGTVVAIQGATRLDPTEDQC